MEDKIESKMETQQVGEGFKDAYKSYSAYDAILAKTTNFDAALNDDVSQFRDDSNIKALQNLLLGQRTALFGGDEARILKHRQHIIDYVPRFRPALLAGVSPYKQYLETEAVRSLITHSIRREASNSSTQLDFMLGGYYDARNLFSTLIDAAEWELTESPRHQYHFTMVNDMPHYAARLAVFCYLMMTSQDDDKADLDLLVASMAFAVSRIPQFVYDQLIEAINAVKESLEHDGTVARCPFLWIPDSSIPDIVNCLDHWGEEKPYQRNKLPFEDQEDENTHASDRKVWDAARIVRIPDALLAKYDPRLAKVIQNFEKRDYNNQTKVKRFKALINAEWIVNPFLWDATVSPILNNLDVDDPPLTAEDLIEHIPCFDGKPDRTLPVLSTIYNFFAKVGMALQSVQKRIVIEAFTGDLDETCERMSLRYLPHRESGLVNGRPDLDATLFPWVYDHIHCSNCYEYTGGMLPMMKHCLPLLKYAHQSVVSACFLRNKNVIATINSFVAEFSALHTADMLYDMAGASVDPKCEFMEKRRNSPSEAKYELQWDHSWWRTRDIPSHLPMSVRSLPESTQKLSLDNLALTTYEQFLSWGLLLFFQTMEPRVQSNADDLEDTVVKCKPGNVAGYLRTLDFAHRYGGFPGHWINSLLSEIMREEPIGAATMSPSRQHIFLATPTEPLAHRPSAGKVAKTPSTSNTLYWAAEVSTMLSIWRPVLGWGLVLPDMLSGTMTSQTAPIREVLPPLSSICRYSVTISDIAPYEGLAAPHLALLLWDIQRLGSPPSPAKLIPINPGTDCKGGGGGRDGNTSKQSKTNQNKKGKRNSQEEKKVVTQASTLKGDATVGSTKNIAAAHVITVFEWKWDDVDKRTGVATWWMRADVMDVIRADDQDAGPGPGWELCLWRTNRRQVVSHAKVRAQEIDSHGTWEELLGSDDNGILPPRCEQNGYFNAPITYIPYVSNKADYEIRAGQAWFQNSAK